MVPVWLWDSAPMRRALARVDVGAVVAILRGAAGLSQLDLANLVEGWSQSTVSLVEHGRRDTVYDVRELLRFADAVDMPREALLPLVLGDPSATLETNGLDLAGVVDLDRRSFNQMSAGLAVGAILPAVRVPARVDAAHVRYLRACLERLRGRDRTIGGGAIVRQALRQFARARAMLEESDYTETVRRELLVVAADLGIVAGWLAYDSGDQRTARQLYGEAELLAGSAGDTEVAVHVFVNMAQQSTHVARMSDRRGVAREGLRFAERAADAAQHEPSARLHALIALRGALAHARLGDEVAFRSAISRARRELDRGEHPADPTWSLFVSESEIVGYEAMGYDQLGKPGRAARLYRGVLDDADRSPRDQAYYRARLSGALLEDGDRIQAIDEGLAILPDLGERLTSTRTLNELRPVREAAERVAAEEFIARFDQAARSLSAA
jgi:transcriptional regulator with XRE-family HTH domain